MVTLKSSRETTVIDFGGDVQREAELILILQLRLWVPVSSTAEHHVLSKIMHRGTRVAKGVGGGVVVVVALEAVSTSERRRGSGPSAASGSPPTSHRPVVNLSSTCFALSSTLFIFVFYNLGLLSCGTVQTTVSTSIPISCHPGPFQGIQHRRASVLGSAGCLRCAVIDHLAIYSHVSPGTCGLPPPPFI
jgi:hypothetical protein